jgi:hypothetical protein
MGELDDALAAGQPDESMAEDMVFDAQPEVLTFEHSEDGRVLHYVAKTVVDEIVDAALGADMQTVVQVRDRIDDQL